MAGRRERQKREREARILRVASRLFASRGFQGTSMQDIARSTRLAVGTLYNYFGSKPEIILALVRRDTAEGLVAGEEILKHPPADPIDAVAELLDHALSPFARHDRALCRELVAAAMVDPTIGSGFFASDVRLIGLVTTLLRDLQARGALRADVDAGRAAICLYGVLMTWLLAYLASEVISLEGLRAELHAGVSVVMKGVLEQAPSPRGATS